jgi:hypothetical protein
MKLPKAIRGNAGGSAGRLRRALRRLANSAALACASRSPEKTRAALQSLSAEVERADQVINSIKQAERPKLNALDLCRSMLNHSKDRENLRAPEDDEIRELCERIGYGAVMDSAARQWRKKDPITAFVTGPCIGTLIHYLADRSE